MNVSIVQVDNLRREPIDVSAALALEIELDNGARFKISLSPADYLQVHGEGVLQVEPRAANAVHIRVK